MNKIIFLDWDGVCNQHIQFDNGYYGSEHHNITWLNYILAKVPDSQIVLSSAWRYMILNGAMELRGFEYLMLTHGVNCEGRLIGHTVADDPLPMSLTDDWGIRQREKQIRGWLTMFSHTCKGTLNFVVLDDLPLQIDNFVKCESHVGLTEKLAKQAVKILKEKT